MSAIRRAADRLLELPLVYQTWQAPFASAKLKPFLARLDLAQTRRVLDIGCGPGTNARAFAGCDYVGIDINAEYIRTASSRHPGRWVVGDVTDETIFPDEHFDCVFANSLMHHLDDGAVRNLLRRMARLTAPGGKVHVLDLVLPAHASAGRWLARLDRGRFARPVDHWRTLFTEHLREEHFQPYAFGLPGLPLWQMVYFVGVPQVSSRRVTIAIPIHNEEEVLPALLQRVFAVLDQTPGGPHELLLVDDGSRDGSLRILEEATERDPRLRVLVLSRNFGHQAAVSAAFDHASGDVMMVMDGDLQDAPEALPILLERLDEGFDVVYVRRTRRKEPFWLRTSYHLAYRIISRMSKLALPVDAGDFALLSRRAVDAVRALPERQRYLRGLRSWVGFRQTGEVIERYARAAGESKYSVSALIALALDGTFAFSTAPLRLIGALGGFVLLLAGLFSLYAVYARLVLGRSPQGFTALTVLVTVIGGMILISLWIIGEDVGRIYEEVKHRPIYLIDRTLGGGRRPEPPG